LSLGYERLEASKYFHAGNQLEIPQNNYLCFPTKNIVKETYNNGNLIKYCAVPFFESYESRIKK
jgi:hypothetical protein